MLKLMPRLLDLDSPRTPRFALADRLKTLREVGIAAERFPAYVNLELKPHGLDVVLFTCVARGRGVHHMGDLALEVGPGSVGITHYDQQHDLLTEPAGVDVINVYLDLRGHPLPVVPPPWDRTLASLLAPHPGLVHDHNRRVHVTFDDPARMTQPLDWMIREQDEAGPGHLAMLQQLLVVFLVELCRTADRAGWSSSVLAERDDPVWLDAVRAFVDQKHDTPIGLPDLCKIAGVGPEHLCRRFKKYTGQTPIAYLNDRRLQSALWLLRTTERSITDIALASGFAGVSYFNRRFKAATGQTPSGYRRQLTR